jgi:hypothetical protein
MGSIATAGTAGESPALLPPPLRVPQIRARVANVESLTGTHLCFSCAHRIPRKRCGSLRSTLPRRRFRILAVVAVAGAEQSAESRGKDTTRGTGPPSAWEVQLLTTTPVDSCCSPKCGSAALSLPAHSRGEAHFRYRHILYSRKVDTTLVQASAVPCRYPCVSTASWLSRLLRHHVHQAVWLHIPPVRDPAAVAGHCTDCPCVGHQVWKGCHTLLRFWRNCYEQAHRVRGSGTGEEHLGSGRCVELSKNQVRRVVFIRGRWKNRHIVGGSKPGRSSSRAPSSTAELLGQWEVTASVGS